MTAHAQYPPQVWALFQSDDAAGAPEAGGNWVSAQAVELLTQTRVRFFVSVRDGQIAGLRYEVRGCPYTVAAAAWMAQRWVGLAVDDVRLDARGLVAELSAPITKLGRLLVVEEAFRKSLQEAAAKL